MTAVDKNAQVSDCQFILITKLPSGDCHVVRITNQELKNVMEKVGTFLIDDKKIDNFNFTPVLKRI